jgi:hypothetical protein
MVIITKQTMQTLSQNGLICVYFEPLFKLCNLKPVCYCVLQALRDAGTEGVLELAG